VTEHPHVIDYKFYGVLAAHCQGFISEKRAVGHIYNSEAKKMREFSRFSQNFDIPENTLTEETVLAWIVKRPTDSERNRYARFCVIKQFSEYMRRLGYEAYCPENDDVPKYRQVYVPHIFTHDEIRRFFAAADIIEPCYKAPRRRLIMPVIFRLLYCCGLRVSEALRLLSDDVDLSTGILTIRDSKFGKTRYVPMSKEIASACRKYAETRPAAPSGDDWFFAAPDGGIYHDHQIYITFRQLLIKARISHGGRGEGPRVHDFRHTYAVHCLQRWARSGKDLTNALPRLSAYMGHTGFKATEYYLRMTAEVYPEITATLQAKYGDLIPREVGLR